MRAPTTEQRDVFRSRIILLAAEGRSTRSIARAVNTMPLEKLTSGMTRLVSRSPLISRNSMSTVTLAATSRAKARSPVLRRRGQKGDRWLVATPRLVGTSGRAR